MRSRLIRRGGKWALVGIAIVSGWMLGAMHGSAPAQDMFETPAEYTAGPAMAVDGKGSAGQSVRALDPALLWVPRGDHLEQWDIATAKVVGLVSVDHGPTAVVLSADGKSAYAAAGAAIAVIDTESKTVTSKIEVGSPVSALGNLSADLSKLLAATGTTVKRIDLAKASSQSIDTGGAVDLIVTGGDQAFAVLTDQRKVVALNGLNGVVSATWAIDAKPLAALVDAPNHRLLLACDDRQLRVLDSDNGSIVSTLPIGSGTTGMCLCPAKSTLFIACAGTVDVLHADDASHYSAMKSIPLPPGAHGPTIDPDGKLLTLITDDGGKTTLCVFKRHEQ